MQDDPLLSIAMPGADTFPYAEDRRLFYVTLTRARRSVLLLTVTYRESPLLLEVIDDSAVSPTDVNGNPILMVRCPRCQEWMVKRQGRRASSSAAARTRAAAAAPATSTAPRVGDAH